MFTKTPVVSLQAALGAGLRANREALGMSQAKLAEESSISQRTISEIESGEGNPRLSTIAALAMYVGTTAFDLIASGEEELG